MLVTTAAVVVQAVVDQRRQLGHVPRVPPVSMHRVVGAARPRQGYATVRAYGKEDSQMKAQRDAGDLSAVASGANAVGVVVVDHLAGGRVHAVGEEDRHHLAVEAPGGREVA